MDRFDQIMSILDLQAGWRACTTMKSRVGAMSLVAADVNRWIGSEARQDPLFHKRGPEGSRFMGQGSGSVLKSLAS